MVSMSGSFGNGCIANRVGLPLENKGVIRKLRDKLINGELNYRTENKPLNRTAEYAIEKYYTKAAPFYNNVLSGPKLDKVLREALQFIFSAK